MTVSVITEVIMILTVSPAELAAMQSNEMLDLIDVRDLAEWEAGHIPIDMAPWNAVGRKTGDRFACPGYQRPVRWHLHGPTWRPDMARRGGPRPVPGPSEEHRFGPAQLSRRRQQAASQ